MSWRPVKDFPGYEVSADGAVRSFAARGRSGEPTQPRAITPVWLKNQRWGVRMNRDGVRHLRCVANLVLEAFVGPPPGTDHVVFADGDSSNIKLSNISWKTP